MSPHLSRRPHLSCHPQLSCPPPVMPPTCHAAHLSCRLHLSSRGAWRRSNPPPGLRDGSPCGCLRHRWRALDASGRSGRVPHDMQHSRAARTGSASAPARRCQLPACLAASVQRRCDRLGGLKNASNIARLVRKIPDEGDFLYWRQSHDGAASPTQSASGGRVGGWLRIEGDRDKPAYGGEPTHHDRCSTLFRDQFVLPATLSDFDPIAVSVIAAKSRLPI
jgi:hypothetical protein